MKSSLKGHAAILGPAVIGLCGLALLLGAQTVQAAGSHKTAYMHADKGLDLHKKLDFRVGQSLFEKLWVSSPASTQASDGLGPLYNARACVSCHPRNGRGKPPATNQDKAVSMLTKIDIPAQDASQQALLNKHQLNNIADPVYGAQIQHFAVAGHKAEFQLQIDYQEKPVELADGEIVLLRQPRYSLIEAGFGPLHPQARMSQRVAPPMIGLGYLEAIEEQVLLAQADPEDSNQDGISGKPNKVWSRLYNKVMLGRFGHKAGMPTLDDQVQSAFSNDIGISTPLYPAAAGDCTAKQVDCLNAPHGNSPQYDNLEAPQQVNDLVNLYVRNIAVPKQRATRQPDLQAGAKLFEQIGCQLCHTPSYEITHNQRPMTLFPYTDLLLHDMGEALADHRPEGQANGREWKTPPLWGIGMTEKVLGYQNYLHDGRARTLLEAILWHGGEAQQQKQAVMSLNKTERDKLIKFIESL